MVHFRSHWLQASLLVGGPGTGKTAIINQFLSHFPEHEYSSKTITFSSLTTPAIFQTFVEVSLFPVITLPRLPPAQSLRD